MPVPSIAERFQAAAGRLPLSALPPGARLELDGLLGRVEAFEDLPGKWQAALLEAERDASRPSDTAHRCCGGHHRAPGS